MGKLTIEKHKFSHLEDHWTAFGLLRNSGKYGHIKGILYPKRIDTPETPEETFCINYLCNEWDYEFHETKPAGVF